MSKPEFVAYLRERGYDATVEDGIVVVEHPEKETFERMKRLAKMVGYSASMCWRRKHDEVRM